MNQIIGNLVLAFSLFLGCSIPLVAGAAQPPEGYCVGKIGNTFQGGCDVIYPDMLSAAEAAIQYGAGWGFDPNSYSGFSWIDSTQCDSFYGANSIACHHRFTWLNMVCSPAPCVIGPQDAGHGIFPICRLLPGQTTRDYPGGTDVNKACPGANISVVRGSSKTSSNTSPCNDPPLGHPIRPVSGRKTKTVDLGFVVGGVRLELAYDTARQLTAIASGKAAKDFGDLPSFGALWFSSLHRKLLLGSGVADLKVLRGDGTHSAFWVNGTTMVTDVDNRDTLTAVTGGYLYRHAQSGVVETYNSTGQITGLADTAGNTLTFFYSTNPSNKAPAAGYLVKVVDNAGRALSFEYSLPAGGVASKDGMISRAVGPDGTSVTFTYDAYRNLSSINWPSGRTHQFLYENPSFTWALTGEVDENNSRWSTYGYDANGLATSTELSNGVDKYSVAYGMPPAQLIGTTYDAATKTNYTYYDVAPPANAVVTDASGNASMLNAIGLNGQPILTGSSQPAGSGCAASNSASSFDSNGNRLLRDDFSGHRVCYAYDANNREIVRVEGLASSVACSAVTSSGATLPSGARKVTTAWHPDWSLPTQIDEPGHRTIMVYHGQADPFNGNVTANCTTAPLMPNSKPLPLVCKRVEQALLANGLVDASVPAVAARFSYDASGHLLTSWDANNQSIVRVYYTDGSFTGNPSGSYDPYFDNISLLLHGNGVNGQVAIADSGPGQKVVTSVGDAKISTAQNQFGGSSMSFDGAGDYLKIPSNADFELGATYTIEYWVRPNNIAANFGMVHRGLYISTNNNWIGLSFSARWLGSYLRVYFYGTTGSNEQKIDVPNALAANSWTHVAIVRDGAQGRVYINGVLSGSASGLSTPTESLQPLRIGVWDYSMGAEYLNGYMDDVRITKGVARYAADFTPPAIEFADHGLVLSPSDLGQTVGDLQSITNAAGQVTQFTQYDRAGRVRQMIDPKGVVTDITYTPRGWVSTVTATAPGGSARVTSYSYDGVGQLTGVTQPDGSTLSYSYDAAHRLVGVTDAKGNSVNYTLDNVGNRIAEDIKDPTGVLQRSIGRSFDALNRLQQVSGAAQ